MYSEFLRETDKWLLSQCPSVNRGLPVLCCQEPTKRAGGMIQVVECLPSNCEALSSNSSATKKKKRVHKETTQKALA
jgi:hypothetical protein